jgi:DNA helicase-2/ATP-dependent DNA helicase PcrA
MGEFPDLAAFLEHISLVMDVEGPTEGERISIMTLHAAKGLEFEIVFLPGWEEGLFPNQRSMDDSGRAGLEEERRLAYVGLTRARSEVKIYHAANRRVRGLWQASIPSRFIQELPADHTEFEETAGAAAFGGYSASRFDAPASGFASRYDTPGWRRAEERTRRADEKGGRFGGGSGRILEGQAQRRAPQEAVFEAGARVLHLKFGPGSVVATDGPKLTVDFDHAGRKLVMDSFVTAES